MISDDLGGALVMGLTQRTEQIQRLKGQIARVPILSQNSSARRARAVRMVCADPEGFSKTDGE